MRFLKKDFLIIILITSVIGLMGYSILRNDLTILAGILIPLFSLAGIYIAYFFPKLFCYLIILSAPLSLNTDIAGGLALSLPAEGMLGLLLLLSVIKAIGGLKFNKNIVQHPITLVLFGTIIWMLASSATSTMPDISFKRIILKISFILGFYFVFAHLFLEEKSRNKLFLLYAIGLILPIINALITHSQFNFSQEESFEMTEPFYEEHTIYGACLAFIIPFLLLFTINKFKTKAISLISYFWAAMLLFVVIAELLSYSRASWLSIIGAFGVFFLSTLKIKPIYYLLVSVVIVGTLSFNFNSIYDSIRSGDSKKNNDNVEQHLETVTDLKSNASNLERINRWVCAYRMFAEKPFLGWGPGTYQFQYSRFQTQEFTTEISSNSGDRGNAHSEYLTYLAEEGVIGFILFIMLIILSVGKSLSLLNKIKLYKDKIILYGFLLGLVTFFLHGFFNAFSDYEKMSILVYGSLAGIVAIDTKRPA
jgi:O-antigen ligase